MKKLDIKGTIIGAGRPVICVPITHETEHEIIKEAKLLAEDQVKLIEWRVDWFEGIKNEAEVLAVLQKMQEFMQNTILLVTYRSKNQGGQGELTRDEKQKLLFSMAESGCVDILDMEFFEEDCPGRTIRDLQNKGVFVLASHHDFHETPDTKVMKMILDKMYLGGADIVKLAVMPENMNDVLRLLAVTDEFREEKKDTPVVTMSMGKYGMMSRLCGEFFGSAITFGSHERASAPGQIGMKDLEVILDKIHESYEGNGAE